MNIVRNKYFWIVLGILIIILDAFVGKGRALSGELGFILPYLIGLALTVIIFGIFLWLAGRWTKVQNISFSVSFGIGAAIKIAIPYIDTFLLSKMITPDLFGTSVELSLIYGVMIMTSMIFTILLVKYLFNTTWIQSFRMWLIASSITLVITYILLFISVFTGFPFFIPGSQVLFPM